LFFFWFFFYFQNSVNVMASNAGASSNPTINQSSPSAAPAARVPPKNAAGNKSDIA
jgi:hypothetical protein